MKNMRKLLAVALLIFTMGLPSYADGQMETPKPSAGGSVITTPQPATTQAVEGDPEQSENGQVETTLTVTLGLIESILALI